MILTVYPYSGFTEDYCTPSKPVIEGHRPRGDRDGKETVFLFRFKSIIFLPANPIRFWKRAVDDSLLPCRK